MPPRRSAVGPAAQSDESFAFLKLATELQDIILVFSLTAAEPITIKHSEPKYCWESIRQHISGGLLRVSKDIRARSLRIIFQHNVFNFKSVPIACGFIWKNLGYADQFGALPCDMHIGIIELPLRDIKFDTARYHDCWPAGEGRRLARYLVNAPRLKSLTLPSNILESQPFRTATLPPLVKKYTVAQLLALIRVGPRTRDCDHRGRPIAGIWSEKDEAEKLETYIRGLYAKAQGQ